MQARVEAAARRWFDAPVLTPLGAGHIHDTYLVTVAAKSFVLQRVNEVVFKDAGLVMAQTRRVLEQWCKQSTFTVPELQPSKRGATAERVEGDLWRVWRYISGTKVVDPIETLAQASAAGAAFAALQAELALLPGPPLRESIAGFLQLDHYLKAYDAVRASAPKDLDALVQANRGLAQQIGGRNAHIHGDCKVNNLLFDEQGERVVAIIDFDTAMYGHWAWDFGDLVRSLSYSKGRADVDFFAACLQGFARHQPLTNSRDAVAAPGYVALMLGVRFITDHLSGDQYFRVSQPGENLVRAREQFALFADFTARHTEFLTAAGDVLQGR